MPHRAFCKIRTREVLQTTKSYLVHWFASKFVPAKDEQISQSLDEVDGTQQTRPDSSGSPKVQLLG